MYLGGVLIEFESNLDDFRSGRTLMVLGLVNNSVNDCNIYWWRIWPTESTEQEHIWFASKFHSTLEV